MRPRDSAARRVERPGGQHGDRPRLRSARDQTRRCIGIAALVSASFCAVAPAQTGTTPSVPTGPIKVTSQRADIDEQGKVMLYRGKVRLTKGQLELRGERLELRQPAQGQFEARVSGKPARLSQPGQGDAPPVMASADSIVYDSRAATLNLHGSAQLERGGDVLSGDSIRYDLASRRISASGTGGEQIRFVIQPPEDRKAPVDQAPPPPAETTAPAPAGPAP